MEARDDRPPYVVFQTRPVEDRAASEEAGYYVAKDVIFAVITPMGSKDRIERIAEDWLKSLEGQVQEGRFQRTWLEQYKLAYKDFKEGREVPENGIPILGWTVVAQSQQEAIIAAGIRTVEDLAAANENAIQLMGIGGRSFKQKAQAWLDSLDTAKTALELEKLRVKVEEMSSKLDSVTTERDALAERLKVHEKAKESVKA